MDSRCGWAGPQDCCTALQAACLQVASRAEPLLGALWQDSMAGREAAAVRLRRQCELWWTPRSAPLIGSPPHSTFHFEVRHTVGGWEANCRRHSTARTSGLPVWPAVAACPLIHTDHPSARVSAGVLVAVTDESEPVVLEVCPAPLLGWLLVGR